MKAGIKALGANGGWRRAVRAEDALRIFFDGSCEPINPGGTAGFGAVIFESRKLLWQTSGALDPRDGPTSNNVAEYAALIAALEYLLTKRWQNRRIEIRGDSKLVIQQCRGEWEVKSGRYAPYAHRAQELLKQFPNVTFQWVPRAENQVADELSMVELTKRGIARRVR